MANELVYGAQLAVLDFAGLSLTGTDYSARFLVDFDIASQFPLEAIEADAPSDWPTYIRGDPGSKIVPVHITIDALPSSQNLIDTLKTTFSPSGDIDFLRVRDENGNVRRMRAKSLGLVPWEGHDDVSYVASLHAPEPVWESDEPDVIFYNVSGSAGTTSASWEIINSGNEECFPVITITPYANRSGAGAGAHQLPIVIAWRSSLEGVDSQGLPYPIDVTDGAWDTSALADFNVTGSAAYVRAWLDGVEISRYVENPDTANTSVWCSIPFQPTRQAELFANVTGTDTALSVTSADDLAAFPDTGFVLVGTECIAYQGKTATSLLALKRAQRGTAAASHAAGATIYWVEHDIRLTWGDVIPFVAGQELDDEKPIIDLAMSTNEHHYYGTADGLIEPETLRTGQWVRELRAPAGGRRAAYSSLSQAAGVPTFADQLPEAGAPNFDSLSLYTPCFVSANVTGVALDAEVDHHMICELFGIDAGGFESLVHQRSACGWISGFDTADDVPYVSVPAFESLAILPTDDLTRLTLVSLTNAMTGIEPASDSLSYPPIADTGSGRRAAQVFALSAETELVEVSFWAKKNAGWDGTLRVELYIASPAAPDGTLLFTISAIANVDLPSDGAMTARLYANGALNRIRTSGRVAVVFTSGGGGTTGTLLGHKVAARNPGGSFWTSVTPPLVEQPQEDLAVMLCDLDAEPQPDASMDTGNTVRYRNVDVHFNPAYTPLIVLGDDAPAYILDEEVLTNVDTGESLILTGVLPIADIADDIAKIDASSHVLTVLRDGVDGYEQAAGYFSEPSDVTTWIRLLPGVNHLQMSQMGGGSRLGLRFYSRSRWT